MLFSSDSQEEIVEMSLIIRKISLHNKPVAVKNSCQQEIQIRLGFPSQRKKKKNRMRAIIELFSKLCYYSEKEQS